MTSRVPLSTSQPTPPTRESVIVINRHTNPWTEGKDDEVLINVLPEVPNEQTLEASPHELVSPILEGNRSLILIFKGV